ncbi:hypothetical protein B0H13DRAFT_2426922 [Mycena leptocephala]|nr:hypothetical protein B0H13DRAFT_2426922 [Mycena leptocephala]
MASLSHTPVDISRIIIEGYLALLYTHRDHAGGFFPLLPWLHSSEACEHVFGEARRIVKDFSMLNLLYMIPKLKVKLRSAVLRAKSANGKACAAGYAHTYFDKTGIDIIALTTFPTDEEIPDIAHQAAEESDSLIALCGLGPSQMRSAAARMAPILPSINAWFEDESEDLSDTGSDMDSISSAQELQDLIDRAEDPTVSRSRARGDQFVNLTCAALALSADEMMKIQSLPEPEVEVLDELVAEECGSIKATLDITLPVLNISEPTKPLVRGTATAANLNFDSLVQLRREHQPIQAARGVRTRGAAVDSEKVKEQSVRQQLIRKFNELLKEEQDKPIGSGLERNARWRATAPGGRGGNTAGAPSVTGNSANAVLNASALAKKVFYLCYINDAAKKRETVFTKAKVPNLSEIVGARVSRFRPIRIEDYGIIWTAHGLRVARVFALHAKGGGQHGAHQPVTESAMIRAISYASIQIYEHYHGAQFRDIPTETAQLQTKQFGHILSIGFLCLLSTPPKVIVTGLELSQEDAARFTKLSAGLKQFDAAMKLFRKREKKDDVAEDGAEE